MARSTMSQSALHAQPANLKQTGFFSTAVSTMSWSSLCASLTYCKHNGFLLTSSSTISRSSQRAPPAKCKQDAFFSTAFNTISRSALQASLAYCKHNGFFSTAMSTNSRLVLHAALACFRQVGSPSMAARTILWSFLQAGCACRMLIGSLLTACNTTCSSALASSAKDSKHLYWSRGLDSNAKHLSRPSRVSSSEENTAVHSTGDASASPACNSALPTINLTPCGGWRTSSSFSCKVCTAVSNAKVCGPRRISPVMPRAVTTTASCMFSCKGAIDTREQPDLPGRGPC
mmetsp:Transcript_16833/g.42811  ORF Transcript_16833/g.42811 Transcript_16833/m.42811 type:complete len:288 (-) Transcript_16833:22-885(-)